MKAAISPYSMAVAADALLAVAVPARAIKVAASAMRRVFIIVISFRIRSRTGEIRMGGPSDDFVRDQRSVKKRRLPLDADAPIPFQRRRVLRSSCTLLPLA